MISSRIEASESRVHFEGLFEHDTDIAISRFLGWK